MSRRWLFADQLGPHFLDSPDQEGLLIEARSVFRRRRFHRQKAHLVLSGLRHRAAELGDQAAYVRCDTCGEALAPYQAKGTPLSVCGPTSEAADTFVRRQPGIDVLPERGFATTREQFATWAERRRGRRLLMEDFYRDVRRRLGVLMDGGEPAGSRWNLDHDNRQPPPATGRLDVDEPWWPVEDAMLAGSWTMAHSTLSAPMNLGLLHPLECVEGAEAAYRAGEAPLASVEGYVRQLLGWRDYVWNVYWHFGPASYRRRNALAAHEPLPRWFTELDAEAVEARCLSDVLSDVRDGAWVHHIPRLMVLGNYALQRGWDPAELTDWFHRCFVDGYDWVMLPNVVGMSQHADGGLMATKPYAAGGAYINKMSDYCGGCSYDPRRRLGEDACPYTAGYWTFLDRNQDTLAGNHRMRQPLAGLRRLGDVADVVAQERRRVGP